MSLSEVVGTTNDIFLSYSSADRDVVRNVARRLREAGVKVWFDKDSLSPGSGWQDELATQLMDSRACAVFVGPDEIVGWKRYEMEVALDRSVKDRDFHVFPVLLPGIEHFDASVLPPFLAMRQWVDLRAGPESVEAIQDLINAMRASRGRSRRWWTADRNARTAVWRCSRRSTRRTFSVVGPRRSDWWRACGRADSSRLSASRASASRRWSEPAYCREYGPARCPGASGGPFSLGGPVTVLTANESPECHPPSVDLRTMSSRVRSRHGAYVDVRIPLLYGRRRPISAPNPRSATRKSG